MHGVALTKPSIMHSIMNFLNNLISYLPSLYNKCSNAISFVHSSNAYEEK